MATNLTHGLSNQYQLNGVWCSFSHCFHHRFWNLDRDTVIRQLFRIQNLDSRFTLPTIMVTLHLACCLSFWFASFLLQLDYWWIYWAGMDAKGFGLPGKLSNVKVILNGGQGITSLRPDGYFSLYPNFLCAYYLQLFLLQPFWEFFQLFFSLVTRFKYRLQYYVIKGIQVNFSGRCLDSLTHMLKAIMCQQGLIWLKWLQ